MRSFCVYMRCLVLAQILSNVECALNSSRTAEILRMIDRRGSILAPREKGQQVDVSVAFHINNMVPLASINDHIHVEMDMTTSWKDKRLQYKAETPNTTIALQNTGSASIWRPDLIVISEKGVKYKTFPKTLSACRISPSGDVLFSQRLSITVFCPMSLASFPFDKQRCHLSFESYTYNTSQLRLMFMNSSGLTGVTFSPSFRVSKFILEKYSFDKRSLDYGVSGFFDQLRITLFLKREIQFYIMEYYFPIISAVFLSFISFWIAHESAPARVSLPVTTFLTLSAMLDHVRTSSGYFGAADTVEIFLNVSIVFVFCVMVEYGIVEAVTFQSAENTADGERDTEREARTTQEHSSSARQYLDRVKAYLNKQSVHSSDGSIFLDQICRYVFPLSYCSFLLLYFVISFVNLNSG